MRQVPEESEDTTMPAL